jgi:uncharacterized membrane protein YeaQ/YmgE (transglycosylase-associated protein family)
MEILLWIVFGGIVGAIASGVMDSGGGLLMDIAVGIIGAVLGGLLMNFLGETGVSGFNIYSFLVAIAGACLFIAIARII